MGLALDEPKTNDKIINAEGFSIMVAAEVADMILPLGNVLIDYKDHFWEKGFRLSFPGKEKDTC
jgi:Fe-S cluster assembly iron-binding protein IscA